MASNWRLTKKEVAHIAYAFEQLKSEQLPGDVYGFEGFSDEEIAALYARFAAAAESNRPSSLHITKKPSKGR